MLGAPLGSLQLLCFMVVGLRRTNPTIDTGLDLSDAYTQALTLFDGPPRSAAPS